PTGNGNLIMPDLCIYPSPRIVPPPGVPHPGPPPSSPDGNAHARIICEVANFQSTRSLITKCNEWLRESYVRYVIGIKLHSKSKVAKNAQGQWHRAMTAMLWQQGVAQVSEWDFGSYKAGSPTHAPTGCNALGLAQFQINIPVSD
ncbi:10362_t:CDS:2, partial [Paraglomus brasilianum]